MNDNIKENGIDEVIPEAKRKRITFAGLWKEFLNFFIVILLVIFHYFLLFAPDRLLKLIREVW